MVTPEGRVKILDFERAIIARRRINPCISPEFVHEYLDEGNDADAIERKCPAPVLK